MAVSTATREKCYRAYMDFFETAERKRRWNVWDDIPWDKLEQTQRTETKAICAETFAGVEMYVPDYTSKALGITREVWGDAWFIANWGYEESKHGLAFREYLIRSGLRTEEEFEAFEKAIFSKEWNLPFDTQRRVNCYSALQEAATYLIYKQQRELAQREGDPILERIYFFVGRDEAAHAGHYRRRLEIEMEEDRDGTIEDLAHVVSCFWMPGTGLVPEWESRLAVDGVAITPQHFLQYGVYPLLRKLGTNRAELFRAVRRKAERENEKPRFGYSAVRGEGPALHA